MTTFFETYLKLTDEEEDNLQEEVKHLNPDEEAKVMELMTSYERKGMEKGIEKGLEQGIEKGMEKGLEQGMEKGMEKGIKKVAVNLLADGMAVPKVAELTGLGEKEVMALKHRQNRHE